MLRMDGKNVNFNGVSIIDDVQLASMSASASNGTNIYFSVNIENVASYRLNAAAVDADIEAFKDAVMDAV